MDELLTVTQVAKILGISRTAVLKKIKTGSLTAKKIGNSYIVNRDDVQIIPDRHVSSAQKATIDASVAKTIDEYGETLRLLKDS